MTEKKPWKQSPPAALHHSREVFTHGRPGPHQHGRSVCIRELQDVDAECFLWDLTLALTALSETSASCVLTWVEFHNKLPISVRYRTENTAAALGLFTPPTLPFSVVMSYPVLFRPCWRSAQVSAAAVLTVLGGRSLFLKRGGTLSLLSQCFQDGSAVVARSKAHRKGGVWLWPGRVTSATTELRDPGYHSNMGVSQDKTFTQLLFVGVTATLT